jgi:hypothetical protein
MKEVNEVVQKMSGSDRPGVNRFKLVGFFVVRALVEVQGTASEGKESLYRLYSNCMRHSHWGVG